MRLRGEQEGAALRFDAIVFDFDGVLVESVDIKTSAFSALYRAHGQAVVDRVVGYHATHGGISRFEKFRYFHREFLHAEITPEEEKVLGERFSALVEEAVAAAPWVTGAREFLEAKHRHLPLYVASGTPQDELIRIVGRRAMGRYFRAVYGSPESKAEILRRVIAAGGYSPHRLLMVGDSITDYEGAFAAGTAFLARLPPGEASLFPPSIPTVRDLSGLDAFLAG